ncbi:MAG: Na+/H+ antiporter NhaC family protein [Pseudomonadota bacterium]
MIALTLLPPVLALSLAFLTRNVVLSLLSGLVLAEVLMAQGDPFTGFMGSVDRMTGVYASPNNTQIIIFCLLVGALINLMQKSGGIAATVQHLIRSGAVGTQRRASMATALTGMMLFIETNISILTAGVLGRPIFDRLQMSRERLAYIVDSTCAPISVLILLNGWGAYALGLVEPYVEDKAISVLAGSIPLNVYAILTIVIVLYTAWTGRLFGPLRSSRTELSDDQETDEPTQAAYMVIPASVLVFGSLGFMLITGEGSILEGDGARSVLMAMCLATTALVIMLAFSNRFGPGQITKTAFDGIGTIVPAVTVIFLSLALGDSLRALGTGDVIASLATAFPAAFAFPALMFIAAAATSFSIGTSWGTYGILIPVAMPLALGADLPPSLMLAAVLGGGVFGDHASPISDTTLIASLAAGCDHIEHVRTQLPYALAAAGAASVLYLVMGMVALMS